MPVVCTNLQWVLFCRKWGALCCSFASSKFTWRFSDQQCWLMPFFLPNLTSSVIFLVALKFSISVRGATITDNMYSVHVDLYKNARVSNVIFSLMLMKPTLLCILCHMSGFFYEFLNILFTRIPILKVLINKLICVLPDSV